MADIRAENTGKLDRYLESIATGGSLGIAVESAQSKMACIISAEKKISDKLLISNYRSSCFARMSLSPLRRHQYCLFTPIPPPWNPKSDNDRFGRRCKLKKFLTARRYAYWGGRNPRSGLRPLQAIDSFIQPLTVALLIIGVGCYQSIQVLAYPRMSVINSHPDVCLRLSMPYHSAYLYNVSEGAIGSDTTLRSATSILIQSICLLWVTSALSNYIRP